MLPLDLHVLSLSLAFILSQDQTLRCLNCFIILAPESVIVVQSHTSLTVSIRKISSPILVLLVELCKSLKELFCRFRFANVAAKIRTFILNLQIISELFSKSLFHHFGPAFSLECGCKSSAIKHNYQTFSVLFFKFFSRLNKLYNVRVIKPYYSILTLLETSCYRDIACRTSTWRYIMIY